MTVSLITGAGSGLGAAYAAALHARGDRVVLIDRDGPAVERVARELGEGALAATADVADPPALEHAVAAATAAFGRLDNVVANAGITVGGSSPTWQMAVEDWRRSIDVNLTGVWSTVRASAPALIEAGGGCLLLVSSVAGLSGSPNWGAYAAAKHGVIGLMRTLANELAPRRIRCNALCPGMVRTPMLYEDGRSIGLDVAATEREFVAGHLEQRLIEPEEMATIVCFLLSPASALINGQAIPADLGYLARTPGT